MAKTLPAYLSPEKPGVSTGLKTITGAALMQKELPEPPAIVPGFFVQGLTLLASRPKLGKSWLMLAVALAVALGGRALGKIQVEKGEALYLGLEDNERRLQSRLEVITDHVPDGLHLATSGSMARLYEGGLEQLDTWLTEHPACRLVVIDTLARVRPQRRHGADLYEEDAALGAKLQAIALKHGIALVLVHHVRKALAEDFLDTVSGSTGLTGIADAVLVLTRQRGEADAVLYVTGRDIEEGEHALQFDPQRGLWSLLGDAAVYALTKERQAILVYLSGRAEPASPKEIAEGTGLPRTSTRNLLAKLKDDGLVRCPERGLYTVCNNTDDSGDNGGEKELGTAQTPVTAPVIGKQDAVTAPMTGRDGVQDGLDIFPVIAVTDVARNDTPPEVRELYGLWKGKRLDGVVLELPDRTVPDLGAALTPYFAKKQVSSREKGELLEFAKAVFTEIPPGVLVELTT